jgi:hypothetical protein
MGQITKIYLGGEKKLTRYSPSAPTYIGTGDTADKVLLNPAIAGETTAQGLLEVLESRASAGNATIEGPALSNLGGHRVVALVQGGINYATNTDLIYAKAALGITTGASSINTQCVATAEGEIIEPAWSWAVPGIIFLGESGLLTQSVPDSPALFSRVVGYATAPTKMFVNVQPPIVLGT